MDHSKKTHLDAPAGVPPLAGICTYRQAAEPGLDVETTIRRLRRYVYIQTRLVQIISAHLNAVPEWEVKGALSLHVWQNAEHGTWLRQRVTEMRTPPLRLDQVPDPALALFLDELLHATNTQELLTGLYRVLVPALVEAMQAHVREANPIADYPTLRWLRFALLDKADQVAWAESALAALSEAQAAGQEHDSSDAWASHLSLYLAAAGGIHGEDERVPVAALPPPRAALPFEPDRVPRRDARFTRIRDSRGPWITTDRPLEERVWFMSYVRLTEMHVPELLALILFDWADQSWEMSHDLTRHLWDEARHSMMGEAVFASRGFDWTKTAQDVGFAFYPNTTLAPQDRYALLWLVEQNQMHKSGKFAEHALAQEACDPLMTTFQDFDWADEVLHTQIGRRWLIPAFGNSRALLTQRAEEVRQAYSDCVNADLEKPDAEWWGRYYCEVIQGTQAK